MATFNQQGQHVGTQYNADVMNFGAVHNRAEFVGELSKLRGEVDKAASAGAIDKEVATDARYQLDKAAQQADKPAPDKDAIVGHLTAARDLMKEVGSVAGLATGLAQAIEKVGLIF